MANPVPSVGRVSLHDIVKRLLRDAHAHHSHRPDRPWSLGLILRGQASYDQLLAWAQHDPMPVHKDLCEAIGDDLLYDGGRISRSAAYGLALLALAAEHGRRHAHARMVWDTFREIPFTADARSRLLTPTGQPTPGFKIAIEDAVRRFRLRNYLDRPDTHRFATTVFLQFGVPIQSVPQLPNWLANIGVASDAVQVLVSGADGDDAFKVCWNAMLKRGSSRTPDQLRRLLSESDWFGWSDDMAIAASNAAFAPRRTTIDVPAELVEPETENDGRSIVSAPRYRVGSPAHAPEFVVNLQPLPFDPHQPAVLDLYVNGVRVIRLVGSGSVYSPIDGQTTRSLPRALESAVVLQDRQGNQVDDAQMISLLGEEGDAVGVFDAQTGEFASAPLRGDRSYVLVLGSGVTLDTEATLSVPFGEGTVAWLQAPWTSARARADGEVVWQASAGAPPVRKPRAAPGRELSLEILRRDAWIPVSDTETLDAEELRTTSIRIRNSNAAEGGSLVDGDRAIRKVPGRAVRLSGIQGWGEPLWLARGAAPADPDVRSQRLVASIVDHGVVAGLESGRLELRMPIPWTAEHHLIAWLRDGSIRELVPENTTQSEEHLALAIAARPGELRAVAIACNSARLGAWWASDWSHELPDSEADADRAFVAARWMKLPIIAEPHRGHLQALAGKHLGLAWRNWVRPPGPEMLDAFPISVDRSPAWYSAARAVLYDCELDRAKRDAIDDALQGAEGHSFVRTYAGLAGVGAEARLPRFLRLEIGPEPIVKYHLLSKGRAQDYAKMTQWYYLGGDEQPDGRRVKKLQNDLGKQSFSELGLSPAAVGALVDRTTSWYPVRCALANEAFRAYAAVIRLDPIARPDLYAPRG